MTDTSKPKGSFAFVMANGEFVTPRGRLVWPKLLEPKSIKGDPNSKPRYTATLLIPKGSDIKALTDGIAEVARDEFGKEWQGKKLRMPLGKTADHETLKQYAEEFPWYINATASAEYAPFVFGPDAKQFAGKPADIYSGRWAVMGGKPYAYNNVSKGVSFGLNRVQLLQHAEAIAGGRVSTAEGFEAIDVGGDADEMWDPSK